MLNLNFNPFPRLQTSRLSLRELGLEDAEAIFIQRSHPLINKYIHREPAKSLEDAIEFIKRVKHNQANNKSIQWTITYLGHDTLIGTICLWNIDAIKSTAEIGYSLHPDYFKQGLMNEALIAVKNYGFTIMNVSRIDAFTNKENKASINLLTRNGFTRNITLENLLEDQTELLYNQIFSVLNTAQSF